MNSREWNLIPASVQIKLLLRRISRQWIMPLSSLMFLLALAGLYLGIETQRNLKQYQLVEQKLLPMREMMQQIDTIEADLRTIAAERKRYEQVSSGPAPLDLLKVLTHSMQACERAIILNRFSSHLIDKSSTAPGQQPVSHTNVVSLAQTISVSISGNSADDATISQFIEHLKNSGVFANIELKSSTQSEADQKLAKSFQLELELETEAKP